MKPQVTAEREIKSRRRGRVVLTQSKVRSALTNGSSILKDVDHRTAMMRRFRDLMRAHESDAGGYDALSGGQKAIIRRAAMLEVQCELYEAKFAENDSTASRHDLDCYQRASNSMRRLLESLNLHRGRVARDVTSLGDILRNGHREVRP